MSHQPRYRQIAAEIAQAIQQGIYPPGSKIPSTAELCNDYKVSTTVVNQAVMLLQADGLIEGVPGLGRYVKQ